MEETDMKTNTTVFDEKTQVKIDRLTAQYKDKSLSRSERQEVLRELNHVRYAADPRPSISLRKQTVYEAVIWFLDTIVFGCITFTKNEMNEGLGNVFSLVLFTAMMITVLFVVAAERKYKKEPDDELSLKSKKRASELAMLTMLIILAAVGWAVFTVMEKTFALNTDNWLGLFCTGVFLYSFLDKLFFLMIEGKDAQEDE